MCMCTKQNDHTWLCVTCAKNVKDGVKFDVLFTHLHKNMETQKY